MTTELERIRAPWLLSLRQVVPDDRVVPLIGERLRWARTSHGDVSPALVADRGPSVRTYVSSSHHRGIRRIRNRMSRGPVLRSGTGRRPETSPGCSARSSGCSGDRDRELGRACALDVPAERDFFRAPAAPCRARRGAAHHPAPRRQLAAYVLCFLEGATHRMWNCRFDPAWGPLQPWQARDRRVGRALPLPGSRGLRLHGGVSPTRTATPTRGPSRWSRGRPRGLLEQQASRPIWPRGSGCVAWKPQTAELPSWRSGPRNSSRERAGTSEQPVTNLRTIPSPGGPGPTVAHHGGRGRRPATPPDRAGP